MLKISKHQRNANQNHHEILSHTVRMAIIKKTGDNKCWQRCGEKENVQWGCIENMEGSQKLKIGLPYDLEVILLGIHPKEIKMNFDQIYALLKSRDITLPTKVHLVKAMVFPVVMYGCESWTVKKAERRRIDAFDLWCWRRLLRVPWTARRSNQSILKEISPGCSLEGLM